MTAQPTEDIEPKTVAVPRHVMIASLRRLGVVVGDNLANEELALLAHQWWRSRLN